MRENPHVQFDEGAQETCDIAARLRPTLPQPWLWLGKTEVHQLSRLPKPFRFGARTVCVFCHRSSDHLW